MPQTELTLREKKYATQKIKIMDIFSEKLKEKPLADITVKEIAKELEISEMTFFNYFKNKREVLVYFIEFWNLEMQFKLEQAENLDARASIYLVFEETAKLIEHNYQLFVEIVSNIVLNGIPKKNIKIGRAERLMRFWVDTKHKEGGLKELLMPLIQEMGIDKEKEFFIYTALHNTLFSTPLLMNSPEFKTLKEHYFEQIDYILKSKDDDEPS
jgi:AcrR family transcriptional regulator